jgi:hypothetical protein
LLTPRRKAPAPSATLRGRWFVVAITRLRSLFRLRRNMAREEYSGIEAF